MWSRLYWLSVRRKNENGLIDIDRGFGFVGRILMEGLINMSNNASLLRIGCSLVLMKGDHDRWTISSGDRHLLLSLSNHGIHSGRFLRWKGDVLGW